MKEKSHALLTELADLLERHPEAVVMTEGDESLIDLGLLPIETGRSVPFAQALRWSSPGVRVGNGMWRIPRAGIRPAAPAEPEVQVERCRTCDAAVELNETGECRGCWAVRTIGPHSTVSEGDDDAD